MQPTDPDVQPCCGSSACMLTSCHHRIMTEAHTGSVSAASVKAKELLKLGHHQRSSSHRTLAQLPPNLLFTCLFAQALSFPAVHLS